MTSLRLPLLLCCLTFAVAGLGCDKSKAEADDSKKSAKAEGKDSGQDSEQEAGNDAKAKTGEAAKTGETDEPADGDAPAKDSAGEAKPADPDAPTAPVYKEEEGERWLILDHEKVGELELGMKPDDAVKILGEPKEKGEIFMEEATGEYVSSWTFPDKGVTLGMSSNDDKGTDMTVRDISANKSCTLSLPWGLKIGSTRAEVEKIYGDGFDKDFTDEETFVAGSVYGGTFYGFEDGKVTSLFIGAGAE